jgi:acetyltransferase-like isoleucine patch superfamily enzyme
MAIYTEYNNNVRIEANNIDIGNNPKLGKNISIKVRGDFKLGDNAKVGDGLKIVGENIHIGDDFYYGPTRYGFFEIGGGGANFPFANFEIGNGCVVHTGYINLSRSVKIGNNVGLSHEVDIITHGFWHSVLKGGISTFAGVNIGNDVIIGWKTVIMSGVNIADNVIVGSNSTVVKSLTESGIYVGAPAKLIKHIEEPTHEEKIKIFQKIILDFVELLTYYETNTEINIEIVDYPKIKINDLILDIENLTYSGNHDVLTDAFRDFLRRYGIRIHAPHGFSFNLKRK